MPRASCPLRTGAEEALPRSASSPTSRSTLHQPCPGRAGRRSGYVVTTNPRRAREAGALPRRAGVDIVAPSDMMDGRVGRLRAASTPSAHHVRILGTPRNILVVLRPLPRCGGIRTTSARATRNLPDGSGQLRRGPARGSLDLEEGADFVMVKPGMPYLDIVRRVKDRSECPPCLPVSGEYAMLKAAAARAGSMATPA